MPLSAAPNTPEMPLGSYRCRGPRCAGCWKRLWRGPCRPSRHSRPGTSPPTAAAPAQATPHVAVSKDRHARCPQEQSGPPEDLSCSAGRPVGAGRRKRGSRRPGVLPAPLESSTVARQRPPGTTKRGFRADPPAHRHHVNSCLVPRTASLPLGHLWLSSNCLCGRQSSLDGHLGCFHFSATVNSAALNICAQASTWTCVINCP